MIDNIKEFRVVGEDENNSYAIRYSDNGPTYDLRTYFGNVRRFQSVCKALQNKGYVYNEKKSLQHGVTLFTWPEA